MFLTMVTVAPRDTDFVHAFSGCDQLTSGFTNDA
jgi:hypothetical protein